MQANLTVIPGSVNRFRKFYLFIDKNISGKQLSQAICSKYVYRLFHPPKFKIFSTKLNMMVKVVKLIAGVLRKSYSDEFYRKTPMQESVFNIFPHLQAKERLLHRCFPMCFPKYLRTLFLHNRSG